MPMNLQLAAGSGLKGEPGQRYSLVYWHVVSSKAMSCISAFVEHLLCGGNNKNVLLYILIFFFLGSKNENISSFQYLQSCKIHQMRNYNRLIDAG